MNFTGDCCGSQTWQTRRGWRLRHGSVRTIWTRLARSGTGGPRPGAKTEGGQEDLSDAAAALGELAGRPAPPAWVRAELRTFAEQLDEAVHVDFGEAVHLAPVIEALLDVGVLDLDRRLVLAAKAGAHIAASAASRDGVIVPEYERRLLLEVAAEYGRWQGELAETARTYVGGELAKCLTVAARAVARGAQSDWETGTEEWNELVNLPPGSQDPRIVRGAKLRILPELSTLGHAATGLPHRAGRPAQDRDGR